MTSEDQPARTRLVEALRRDGYERRAEPFRLSSGGMSHDYVDCRRALADGRTLRLAAEVALEVVRARSTTFDVVGGLTMGADPLAHAIALVAPTRWFSVRKAEKAHGTGRRIEGAPVGPGVRVLLVEDVVSTGGSILQACEAVQEAGAEAVLAVAVLDRSGQAGPALSERGVPFVALATWTDLGIAPL